MMPKDRCVICLLPFKDEGEEREKRFEEKGNFCINCNMRCFKVVCGVLTKQDSDKEVRELKRKHKKLKV